MSGGSRKGEGERKREREGEREEEVKKTTNDNVRLGSLMIRNKIDSGQKLNQNDFPQAK